MVLFCDALCFSKHRSALLLAPNILGKLISLNAMASLYFTDSSLGLNDDATVEATSTVIRMSSTTVRFSQDHGVMS